jgi:hypothetical protein
LIFFSFGKKWHAQGLDGANGQRALLTHRRWKDRDLFLDLQSP